MKRALPVCKFLNMKKDVFNLTPAFKKAFGKPERTGVWLIWGGSGNGKTSFAVQLAKEMANHGTVLYNSLEEGFSLTMQNAFKTNGLLERKSKVYITNDDFCTLEKRLEARKHYDIVIIDSVQYTRINWAKYVAFKEKHAANKLLIFTSQAMKKMPREQIGIDVMYDADLKIWVEGYKAFSKGRTYGESGVYTIWHEGAQRYWGTET